MSRKVLLVGDSITQFSFSTELLGFGASLSDWYQRTADVINRGYAGYNTEWIRQAISLVIPLSNSTNNDYEKYILATVFYGANDGTPADSLQHVPLDKFRDNLIFIINHLRTLNPSIVIILITPPTVDHIAWTRSVRHRNIVIEYAKAVIAISQELNTGLLNLWGKELEGNIAFEVTNADLVDGLHLNSNGNKKVFEGIKDVILTNFPHISPVKSDGSPNLSIFLPNFFSFLSISSEEIKESIEKSLSQS